MFFFLFLPKRHPMKKKRKKYNKKIMCLLTLTHENANNLGLKKYTEGKRLERVMCNSLTSNCVIWTDFNPHCSVVNFGELIPNIARNRPHVRSIRSARLNRSYTKYSSKNISLPNTHYITHSISQTSSYSENFSIKY